MNWKSLAGLLALAATTTLAGCGSGGSHGPSATTVVVAFSLISTSQLPTRIGGVNIAARLPAGVSVQTDSVDPKQVSAAALVTGTALDTIPAWNKQVLGSYDSATRQVTISVTAASGTGFAPGEFVRLTCVAAPGVTVTTSEVAALNTPPVAFSASGYDAGTQSTFNLTNYLVPHAALK